MSIERSAQRRCDVCAGERVVPIFEQRFARISGVSILDGYDVVSCVRCGACYADGIPPQSVFDAWYAEGTRFEATDLSGELPAHVRARFAAEIDDLCLYLPDQRARVLEIGCATGALLGMLRDRGYTNVQGLDPSPAAARVARECYGVEVATGSLFLGLPNRPSYDAIVLVGVLEHVRDLGAALARMRAALVPSGLAYIEVPDALEFQRHSDAGFQEFSTLHINYFSPASLSALMAAHGFETVVSLQRDRAHVSGGHDPVVAGFFRRSDAPAPPTVRDSASVEALHAYVRESERREQPLRAQLETLAASPEPMIVWGCGTLTLRLLACSALGRAPITAFVDSNSRFWGRELAGKPILEPDAIRQRREPILVSTLGHRSAIEQHIRATLGCKQQIVSYRA